MNDLFAWFIAAILAVLVVVFKLLCVVVGSVLILYTLDFICGTALFQWDNVAILALAMFLLSSFKHKGQS